jgi:mannitol/fructose-specific phosphotransferase system IIA component (Ntr-type)
LKHKVPQNSSEGLIIPHKKTNCLSSTSISVLILLREIISVQAENHPKPINAICGQNADFMLV